MAKEAKQLKRIGDALDLLNDNVQRILTALTTNEEAPTEGKSTKTTSSSKKSEQTPTTTKKSSSTAQAASKKDSKDTADSAPDIDSADGADGESDDGPTEKDVKTALISLQKAAGDPKPSIVILKKFGATTVPKLKKETYADVIKAAEKAEKKL